MQGIVSTYSSLDGLGDMARGGWIDVATSPVDDLVRMILSEEGTNAEATVYLELAEAERVAAFLVEAASRIRVVSWAFEHSSVENPVDHSVLVALADCARDDGAGAYPSIARLQRMTRWDRRTVCRALDRLRATGAIEAVGKRSRGVVEYRVVMVSTSVTETLVSALAPVAEGHPTSGTQTPVPVAHRHSDQWRSDTQPVHDDTNRSA